MAHTFMWTDPRLLEGRISYSSRKARKKTLVHRDLRFFSRNRIIDERVFNLSLTFRIDYFLNSLLFTSDLYNRAVATDFRPLAMLSPDATQDQQPLSLTSVRH